MCGNRLSQAPSVLATTYWRWVLPALLLAIPSLSPAQPPDPGSQLPNPRILTLSPCGGKAGSTFEVTFTGTDIEEPEALLFSQKGMKADPIEAPPPATPDPKQPPPKPTRRGGQPAKIVASKFRVTIPAGTPAGFHDVRLVNAWGVSNPRAFVVGDQNELSEKEPNDDVPQAQRVEVNTTINGAVQTPVDVDYFVFAGKKGQRIVVSCLASSIDSRLDAGLELYDPAGQRLAINRNYAGGDALLDLTPDRDGDVYVRLFGFSHTQGSPEHFYRLTITTAPWIDAVYPPMVEPGKKVQITLYGRNLPGGKPDPTAVMDGRVLETLAVTFDAPMEPQTLHRLAFSGHLAPSGSHFDGFEYRLRNQVGVSNPVLLTYANAPVVLEGGNNDKPDNAQEVFLPCEIAGRIEKRQDRDWYSFTAKKGDVYAIECFSERLGAPTDMAVFLYGPPNRQQLTELDDDNDALNPVKFFTRSNDPARYRFEVKADGKHYLLVTSQDAELRAGPRHLYRLSITREKPDFRLVVMAADDRRPDACRLLRGGDQFLSVFVWRLDGFDGSITLTADGLPPGVSSAPQVIGPGQKHGNFVVSAAANAAPGVYFIKLTGTATINGKTVAREARPASVTWPIQPQVNIPTVVRLDRSLPIGVNEQAPFHLAATLDKDAVIQGEKANVTVKLTRNWADFKSPLQITPLDPPRTRNQPDFNFANVTIAPDKGDAKIAIDVKSGLPPGIYTLALRGAAQLPFAKDPMAKQKPNVNVVLPSTPFTLTVAPKQLADIRLPNPTLTAHAGTSNELAIQIARQFGYSGDFKLELVPPANAKGIGADAATIAPTQNQGKLLVKLAPDLPPGNYANVIVRATGMFNGKVPVTQETKLTIVVNKKS